MFFTAQTSYKLRYICCSIITLLNGLTREFDDVVHAMKCPTGEQAMTTNTMASTMQHRGR